MNGLGPQINPADHAARERLMRTQTQNMEQQVFEATLKVTRNAYETLWIVNGTLVNLTQEQIERLALNPSIESITFAKKKLKLIAPEGSKPPGRGETYTYGLQKLRVPEVRAQFPDLLGTGIRVGILDTGIDPNHPDLKGKIAAYRDFSPAHDPKPADGFGHGTHVAGTIAGSATSGLSIGIAPKVQLVIGRIFDGGGQSTSDDILRAMQWVADPDGNPDTNDFPPVVNSSWGDDEPYRNRDSQNEPFCKVVDAWISLGIVPVFSAGNSGPNAGTIGLPAGCPNALAVGATEINDRSPHFSSTGPARWKSVDLVKPEVVAPGVDVMSAEVGGGYQEMSGTSMAAPHISGALAIIFQANPKLTADQATKVLLSGVRDLGDAGKDNVFGWGRADLLKSVELARAPQLLRPLINP